MEIKTLNNKMLGEEIIKDEAIAYFGEEIGGLFEFPLHLVATSWTVQDKNGAQMDYQLKHKTYIERKDDGDDYEDND